MRDPIPEAARVAADRLSVELGPALVHDVEAAIHEREAGARAQRYFVDPISLGGLVVSVATLAWTVYKDLKSRTSTPAAPVIERRVRLELPEVQGVEPEQ